MTSSKRHATYLLAVFALSVIIRLFQITAYADNSFGVGLIWSYDQNTHTLSISASGELNEMPDFDDPENDLLSDELPPWNNVINDVETVRIENGVLNIGMNAFYGSKSLKTVIISDGLTIIGSGAFSKCSALKSVVLPDTLKSIGADSFAECISLNDPLFPVNLNVIGSGAFSGCISIKNLRLSQNVTTIMPLAFSGCGNVEKIDVSDKNPVYLSIGNCLIDRNKKSLIFGCKNSVIPSDGTVTSIEPYAFYNCNGLESINVPQINGNKFHICEGAFAGCLSLKNVRYFGNKSELEILLKYNTDNNNEPLKNADRQCF
ncbi:MAG: leucine-rich repeat protein, partial [Clostridia bacterium]|nr:leucine-rich repeat protein [Clostridia bacterium]